MVMLGGMSKSMFLMRNYGLDEVTAKAWIADVQAETPKEPDLFGGGK